VGAGIGVGAGVGAIRAWMMGRLPWGDGIRVGAGDMFTSSWWVQANSREVGRGSTKTPSVDGALTFGVGVVDDVGVWCGRWDWHRCWCSCRMGDVGFEVLVSVLVVLVMLNVRLIGQR